MFEIFFRVILEDWLRFVDYGDRNNILCDLWFTINKKKILNEKKKNLNYWLTRLESGIKIERKEAFLIKF